MKNVVLIVVGLLALNVFGFSQTKSDGSTVESVFKNPPKDARPLCYWFWMGNNFTKYGIKKDLEAMKEMGVGGGIVTNLTSTVVESQNPILNSPWPNHTYRSPAYWEALRFSAAEAKRLGLEIGIHNAVGYSATGGPWINEEKGMQKIIWSKVNVQGGKAISIKLSIPELPINHRWGSNNDRATIFKDIAVLASPDNAEFSFKNIIDLTNKMDSDGNISWDCPSGKWVIYRFISAPSMARPHPVPDELIGKTLEVNKMDSSSNIFHWHEVIDPIKKYLGEYFGKSFTIMHVDSYEAGNQNWTSSFKSEFISMKGYDPTPWLVSMGPLFTENMARNHKVINSELETKAFEWDYSDVVNKLYFKNGWDVAKKIINDNHLKFSWEPYKGPFDIAEGSALADFPMGEFWANQNSAGGISPQIAASARAAGKNIIGAEAFTSIPQNSEWTETPATLKYTADGAFLSGVNKFVLHQWVHQPFDDKYQPGMYMGWWGTHFSRHQTWFEPGKAFINYLNRTSALLQYGEQVSDVLYFQNISGSGDLISKNDFLNSTISVTDGKIILPSGKKYRYMIFPESPEMLPEIANKLKQLIAEGATIVAPKPSASPSLKNYPACNDAIKQIADEVWGTNNAKFNKYGKGYIVTNINAAKEEKLAAFNFLPDYELEQGISEKAIRVIHRHSMETDLFYVVNTSKKQQRLTVAFNIIGKQPELWNVEDGSMSNAPVWYEKEGRTSVLLKLTSLQTVFVVFRKPSNSSDRPRTISVADSASNWSVITAANGKSIFHSNLATTAEVVYVSGKKQTIKTVAKSPIELNNDWSVVFAPKLDKNFSLTFNTLSDFSLNEDKRVKYFAGTATYIKNIKLDNSFVQPNQIIKLDLGEMNNQLAEIFINNKRLGVLWCPPYSIDVTDYLTVGTNEIRIAVTNTWANKIIGDEQEPADFENGEEHTFKKDTVGSPLKAFPDWFINNQPRPSKGRKTFSTWQYYKKDSKLIPAGMVGPVVLKREETVEL